MGYRDGVKRKGDKPGMIVHIWCSTIGDRITLQAPEN